MKQLFQFKKAVLLLMVLLILPSLGQSDSVDDLNEYLQLCTSAYQAQEYAEYRRLMQLIVELDPDNYTYR